MRIRFLWIGKSKQKPINALIEQYSDRLKHYAKHTFTELKPLRQKGMNVDEFKETEGEYIIDHIEVSDFVVLLDERGKHFTSMEYSRWVQHKMNTSIGKVVYIIAGAYGASQKLKDRADHIMSLSHMTLTHDMARVLLIEQTYRSFTILRGEKYHNE